MDHGSNHREPRVAAQADLFRGYLWPGRLRRAGASFRGGRAHGHKDSIIRYIADTGEKWTATIKDFVYFHYMGDNKSKGHNDGIINYVSGDNRGYTGSFAEWFDE